MYQSSYAEVLSESSNESRRVERDALDLAVTLLSAAQGSTDAEPERTEALTYVVQLWGLLIKSLAAPDNDLPKALRASLMSIGLGVMAEAGRIQSGESDDIASLVDICGIIRDGLA